MIDRLVMRCRYPRRYFEGISALETALRTSEGYAAISAMKSAFPDAVIGAGTVAPVTSTDAQWTPVLTLSCHPVPPSSCSGAANHKVSCPWCSNRLEVIVALEKVTRL